MTLISSPLFKTDASEALESADAYEISSTKPINKLFDAAKGVGNKLIDRAGGARGIQNSITRLVQMKSYGATGRDMLEAGIGMFGTSAAGIISSASSSILDKAGGFMDLDPELVGKIKAAGSDVVTAIQYGSADDLSSYGNLTSLIGSLTGYEEFSEYVNIGYESAVWGATLSQAVDYGSSYYIGDVKQYIDPVVYRQALVYSVPAVASSGSMDALNQIMDQLTVDEIMAAKPDFIQTFLSRYFLPASLTMTMEQYGVELFDKMTALEGRWYLYDLAGQDIVDMKYMSNMSMDSRKVLELHGAVREAVQLAPHYRETTVTEAIREHYPLMVTVS